MPYNFSYVIGDKVQHAKLGDGIVVGSKKPQTKSSIAIYHVYYYAKNVFHYNIHASLVKTNNATDKTREEARRILLTKLTEKPTDTEPRKYHIGDTLSHRDQQHMPYKMIVLDNGRLCDGKIQYHIYMPQKRDIHTFSYSVLSDDYTTTPATKYELQQIKKLLFEDFLLPAF